MAAPKIPDDIRTYLINTAGITLPIDVLQISPIDLTNKASINRYAIIEYPGPLNTRVHGVFGSDISFDNTTVQIVSRHRSTETARDNLKTVVDALDGLQDITIGSVTYTYLIRISPIRLLEKSEDGSATFITEFQVQARR